MKLGLRLRGSLSPLFTGRNKSVLETILCNPKLGFSDGGVSSKGFHAGFECVYPSLETAAYNLGTLKKLRIQGVSDRSISFSRNGARGSQDRKHLSHISSDEDEFSELGSPLPKKGRTRLELVTEKRKVSLNANASARAALRMNGIDQKASPLKHDKCTSGYSCLMEDDTKHSTYIKHPEHVPKSEGSTSVTIEKVPDIISLSQLKDAVSVFGEISNASMILGSGGFNTCLVEFKTEESKQRAIASHGIFMQSFHLPIHKLHVEEKSIGIKISNISTDTAESTIHSLCMACGSVEGLSKTKEGAVDVFFSVTGSSTRECILKKLNDMSIDNCQWSAEMIPESRESNVGVVMDNAQLETRLQLGKCVEECLEQFNMKKILFDDLMNLQRNVVHLQDNPIC